MKLQNPANERSLKELKQYLGHKNLRGFFFAQTDQVPLIKSINGELRRHFAQVGREVGILFLDPHLEDKTFIRAIEEYLASKPVCEILIIANLFQYVGDKLRGRQSLEELNVLRDLLYHFEMPILFWITTQTIPLLSRHAGDFWDHRLISPIIFENEPLEISEPQNLSLGKKFEFAAEPPPPANVPPAVLIAKAQFEKALTTVERPVLIRTYLLPYLKILAEHDYRSNVKYYVRQYEADFYFKDYKPYYDLGCILLKILAYKQALNYFEECLKYESNIPKYDLGLTYSHMGRVYIKLGNLESSYTTFRDAAIIFKNLLEANLANLDFKNALAVSYQYLGDIEKQQGNWQVAKAHFRELNELSRELVETAPNNIGFKSGLAISYLRLGDIEKQQGNWQAAKAHFGELNELSHELVKTAPNNTEFRYGLAVSYSRLGDIETQQGNWQAAKNYFEKENQLERQLVEIAPNNTEFKYGLAVSYQHLGSIETQQGNWQAAKNYFEEDNQLSRELAETAPNNTEFKYGLAVCYQNLGILHRDNKPLALYYYFKGRELAEALVLKTPQNVEYRKLLQTINRDIKIAEES